MGSTPNRPPGTPQYYPKRQALIDDPGIGIFDEPKLEPEPYFRDSMGRLPKPIDLNRTPLMDQAAREPIDAVLDRQPPEYDLSPIPNPLTQSTIPENVLNYIIYITGMIVGTLGFSALATFVAPPGDSFFAVGSFLLALASLSFGVTFIIVQINKDYDNENK